MNDIARPSQRRGLAEGLRHERLLTPAEVATMLRVDPKTVTRWANKGLLTCVRTLGGHRRYREADVLSIVRGGRP